jgi:hypothetical protein
MTDILQDLSEAVVEIEDGIRKTMSGTELYLLLSRAVEEIDRLRKRNVELGWAENPDRSGGQFTDEELNRSGWL